MASQPRSDDVEPIPDENVDLSQPLKVHVCYRTWEPALKWAACVDGTYLWKYAELRTEAIRLTIAAYLGLDDDDEEVRPFEKSAKIRQFEVRKGTGLRVRL